MADRLIIQELPVGDIPYELRKHIEESYKQISYTEVDNHHVHTTQLLLTGPKHYEYQAVTYRNRKISVNYESLKLGWL